MLLCSPRLCAGEDFLLSFSTGEGIGWLELGMDWVHFTRSAQLGPVWESRAAAIVGGGPLNETISHHCMRTNKCAHVQWSLYRRQDFQCYASTSSLWAAPKVLPVLQQSEDSAYLTAQHSSLWDSMGLIMINIHFLQHPITAQCTYWTDASAVFNWHFHLHLPLILWALSEKPNKLH